MRSLFPLDLNVPLGFASGKQNSLFPSGPVIKCLVVINDYESASDAVTLIQIPQMISLADFQPLSVAKINIFFISKWGFTERYFSDKLHAIRIGEAPLQNYVA